MLERHNNFDNSTKLFSDLYLAKFLDISIRSFRVECQNILFCSSRLSFL